MQLTKEEILSQGYMDPVQFEDGEWAALIPMMFTWALVHELNNTGYGNRWCYSSYEKAKGALEAWDGQGEPTGWHRHPSSGRRIDEDGKMTINY